MENVTSKRRYILNPVYYLRDWKLQPDGLILIDYKTFPENDRRWYDFGEKNGIVQRCDHEESLLPYRSTDTMTAGGRFLIQTACSGTFGVRVTHSSEEQRFVSSQSSGSFLMVHAGG